MRGRWLFCVAALLFGSATTGCAVMAPGTGFGGGSASLSDAASAARADSTTKVRTLDAGHETPVEAAVEVEVPVSDLGPGSEAPEPAPPKPPRPKQHPLFGVAFGIGALGGEDYDSFDRFGLTGGNFDSSHMRWSVTLSAGDLSFKGESKLGRDLKNTIDLGIDVTGRYYLTEPYTFSGVYALVGGGTGTMFWDYAGPVSVIQDGELRTVEDDYLNFFDFYLGAGSTLVQLAHLHFGGNLVGGVRFWGWHTHNGFDNDMLPTTGYARATCEIEYRH